MSQNKAWEIWKEIVLEIANKHAPLRQRRVKSEYCGWMTEIKKQSYHGEYLKKKAVSLNSPYYFQAYSVYKKRLVFQIQISHNYSDLIVLN